jgi:hypothetical protein
VRTPRFAPAAPGAAAALSVHAGVWAQDFAAAVAGMRDLAAREEPISLRPDPGHAADRALILRFRLP